MQLRFEGLNQISVVTTKLLINLSLERILDVLNAIHPYNSDKKFLLK